MRFAYADPPYVGQARKHYGKHPDFAGEVDQVALVARLVDEYPDGWALSLSCKSLQSILAVCPVDVRVMAWCKPMTPLLPGIRLQYGWEPVILRGGRQGPQPPDSPLLRDWIAVSPDGWAFRPKPTGHVIGRKPEAFCRWLFDCLGATADDTLDDLFPGSGAVGRSFEAWRAQSPLLAADSRPPEPPDIDAHMQAEIESRVREKLRRWAADAVGEVEMSRRIEVLDRLDEWDGAADSRPEQPAPLDVERLAAALCAANVGHYRGWDAAESHATVTPQHREDAEEIVAALAAPVRPEEPPE